VETALIMPLFLMVIFGIITFGIGIFYQQQIANSAREAARFASVSSATAQCPTVSNLNPDPEPLGYFRCDPAPWTEMTGHARTYVFGLPAGAVHYGACWSGYWTKDAADAWSDYDAPPFGPSGSPQPTFYRPCTIGGLDPSTTASSIGCPPPATSASDDTASNLALSYGSSANHVTVYACYQWQPPLAGFLLIPETVTLRATATEAMEYQQ
jgi:hypothetical protein